ncbi:hypothetical protein MC885_007793 [Smutsia gigantea]|nr:hypothetical protein MC885_007793 [Smutsia gigantea]
MELEAQSRGGSFRLGPQWARQVEGGGQLGGGAHRQFWPPQVVGNCRKLGAPEVFYIAADMASPEVPGRVVQFALDLLGGLDYLVLNHLGAIPAGTRARSAQATRWLVQVLRPSAAGSAF